MKIFSNIFLLIVIKFFLNGDAISLDDLQLDFSEKNCIPASLYTTEIEQKYTSRSENIIDESSTVSNNQVANNNKTNENIVENVLLKINELVQFNNIKYQYELIGEEGPPHNKQYEILLRLGDESYQGKGSSLKNAKKLAALLAWQLTEYEKPPTKIKNNENPPTPTVFLNNIGMKLGIPAIYEMVEKDEHDVTTYQNDEPYSKSKKSYLQVLNHSIFHNHHKSQPKVPVEEAQISGPFAIRVKFDKFSFVGVANTKQEARHAAAAKVLEALKQSPPQNDCALAGCEDDNCKRNLDSIRSPITKIYEEGQRRKIEVEFNVISESGPAHKKVFVTECKFDQLRVEGEGKSKKDSKRAAAELMLAKIVDLPQIYNEKSILNYLNTNKKTKNKKKKKKILKTSIDKIGQALSDTLNSVWSTFDSTNKKSVDKAKNDKHLPKSPKDKLLQLSNFLNIEAQFINLDKKGDNFQTLLSLGVEPYQLCLGEAISKQESLDKAALYGLKFLYKTKLLDKTLYNQYVEHIGNVKHDHYIMDEETDFYDTDDVDS